MSSLDRIMLSNRGLRQLISSARASGDLKTEALARLAKLGHKGALRYCAGVLEIDLIQPAQVHWSRDNRDEGKTFDLSHCKTD